MRSVRDAVGLLLGVLVCGAVSAGDLVIGHVPVRLGMAQTEALAALGNEFETRQVSASEGKFLLWTREPETRATYSAGSVSFRGGKLYRASKTWAAAGIKNLNESATGLVGALSAVGCQGRKSCTVKAETLKTPANAPNGQDLDLVTINAPPDRSVVLKIWKPHSGSDRPPFPEWEVEEYLMEAPASP